MTPSQLVRRVIDALTSRARRHGYRSAAQLTVAGVGGQLKWPSSVTAAVPVRVDGLGRVVLHERVNLGWRASPRLGSGEILLQARTPESIIEIGEGTYVNNGCTMVANTLISIGRDCRIGDLVAIYDCDFHELEPSTRNRSPGETCPVVIGDNVWLGSRVMILKGVTIGRNSVVAAGAIVSRDVPPNVLVGGVPAKVIRQL